MPPKPSLLRPATSSSTSSSSYDSFEESRYFVWLEKTKNETKTALFEAKNDELSVEKKGIEKKVKVVKRVVRRVVKKVNKEAIDGETGNLVIDGVNSCSGKVNDLVNDFGGVKEDKKRVAKKVNKEENDGGNRELVIDGVVSCSGEVRIPGNEEDKKRVVEKDDNDSEIGKLVDLVLCSSEVRSLDCNLVSDIKEDTKRVVEKGKKDENDGVIRKLEVGDVGDIDRFKNFRTPNCDIVSDFDTSKEDKMRVETESLRNVVSCLDEVGTRNADVVNASKEDKTGVAKKKRVKKEESDGRFGEINAANTMSFKNVDLGSGKEDKTGVVKDQIVTRGKKRVIKEVNDGELRSEQVSDEAEVGIAKAIEFQISGSEIDNASVKFGVDANIDINAGKELETECLASKGPKRGKKEETSDELDYKAKTETPISSVLGVIEVQTPSSDIAKYSTSLSIGSDHDASSLVDVGNTNVDTKNAIKNEKKVRVVRKKVGTKGTNEVKKVQPFKEREKNEEAKLKNPNPDISNSCISNLLSDISHGSDASNSVNTNTNKEANKMRVMKVGSEGSEKIEGGKLEVESYNVSGVKKDYSMADEMVLSAEMEALERQKRRKTQIFIGGVDKDAVEEDVRVVFQEIGEVVEVKVKMNEKSGKSKGFAFLRYALAADAKKAVEMSGKIEILGKQCSVEFMKGNDTIYLGNIDKTWKNEDIMKLLQDAGVDKIDKITIKPDPGKPECNVGYAFVELETIRDAQITFGLLEKKSVLGNKKIRVEWAKQLSEADEEEMYKVKTVYAEYLPTSWDEEAVKDHFKKFGEIENVVLARNLLTSKRKDFAFINYSNREAALACIKAFTHESLHNEASKVKVCLAKSTPKAKQVKHASAPFTKIPNKEKPKATQSALHLNQLRSSALSTSHYYNNINVMTQPQIRSSGNSTSHQFNKSSVTTSTNDELVQLLREQASWRQPQLSLGTGSTSLDFTHSLPPARKRQYPLEYPNYPDPRGYPRPRTDSAVSSSNPRVLYPDVLIQSQPHYRMQDSSYASGLPNEVDGYLSRSQARGETSLGSGSLAYRRY